jgi:hypothetical protein
MYLRNPALPLSQGDIFPEFPSIYLPNREVLVVSEVEGNERAYQVEAPQPGPWRDAAGRTITKNVIVRAAESNIIVISQTCDVERAETRVIDGMLRPGLRSWVTYCPMIPMRDIEGDQNRLDNIRKNELVYLHWLPEYGSAGIDLAESVVCFPQVSSILKAEVPSQTSDLASRIASLESPFREQVAARFAYFFSRVALPMQYPVGTTHAPGSLVRETGNYVCSACGGENTLLEARDRRRFPNAHCAGARWRFGGRPQ